jgi:uncharacterized protein (DUF1697 family)
MPVLISLLRGINVGGHAKMKMEELRKLYASLKLEMPTTYVQSGNVIFKTSERSLDAVASRIQGAIEKKFKCKPEVILRTTSELRAVIASNPFAKRANIEPGKLLVSFLAANPAKDAQQALRAMKIEPEELHLIGRELYIYFPNGMGKTKLPWSRLDKAIGTPATGRNWNSVTKILEIAEGLEA